MLVIDGVGKVGYPVIDLELETSDILFDDDELEMLLTEED